MRDRINTLLLHANGVGWKAVLADTVLEGALGLSSDSDRDRYNSWNPLVRRYLERRYEALSYLSDWREAFTRARSLAIRSCNINNIRDYVACLRSIADYDLIVILHSAAGDSMALLLKTAWRFANRRGRVVLFVGNEYDLIDEKIRFIRAVQAEYVCSQLPPGAASWLYAECKKSQVLPVPHALNAELYYPAPTGSRTIDVGFRGNTYSFAIGDVERTRLIHLFQERGAEWALRCDIGGAGMPRKNWAAYLRKCRGTVGAESGTYYLDRTGHLMRAATAYLKANPEAPFEEVFSRFFQGCEGPVSGKAISSRHFEAIGTKTCQILIEGTYNGILIGDEHYISVRRDLSNIEEAIRRFKDRAYCEAMVDRTYEYVMAEHTYDKRVAGLLKTVEAGGS